MTSTFHTDSHRPDTVVLFTLRLTPPQAKEVVRGLGEDIASGKPSWGTVEYQGETVAILHVYDVDAAIERVIRSIAMFRGWITPRRRAIARARSLEVLVAKLKAERAKIEDPGVITFKITPAQADVLDSGIYEGGSCDRAIELGVTWTTQKLYVPGDEEARKAIAGYISMRAQIVQDWDGFEDRGVRLASEALWRRARDAGLPVDSSLT